MSVYETNVIDNVSSSPDEGRSLLSILVPERMTANAKLMALLQNKINRYLGYIQSGEFAQGFPQLASLEPWIQVVYDGGDEDVVNSIASSIGPQLSAQDVGLELLDLSKAR